MKTIPLKEAFAKATKGPLKFDGQHLTDKKDNNAATKQNAALLAHCFNHFQEVVEALGDCLPILEKAYETRGTNNQSNPERMALTLAKTALAKASQVEMP